MPDPTPWTSYAGLASGLVGSVAGIAGVILGYLGYSRSKKVKSLDLRVEIRKGIKDIGFDLDKLQETMREAKTLRKNVTAAIGKLKSGETEQWIKDHQTDAERVERISREAPKDDGSLAALTDEELESLLVRVHGLERSVRTALEKYEKSIAYDLERAKEYREIMLSNIRR